MNTSELQRGAKELKVKYGILEAHGILAINRVLQNNGYEKLDGIDLKSDVPSIGTRYVLVNGDGEMVGEWFELPNAEPFIFYADNTVIWNDYIKGVVKWFMDSFMDTP